jgi:hypothetical protein
MCQAHFHRLLALFALPGTVTPTDMMKSFLRVLSLVSVTFAFAGCGPAMVKGPAPNPVGLWEWSDKAQGTWRMEIKPDGTFHREITDPSGKQTAVHGQWNLFFTPKEPTWRERHGLYLKRYAADKVLVNAGNNPNIQWSGLGMLSLHYSATAPSAPVPVPGGPGATPSKGTATPAPAAGGEMIVGDTQSVRTHTDRNTGETYLDVGCKTYQRAAADPATPAPAPPAKANPAP